MSLTMEIQNAAYTFKMPAIELGDEVLWYADGDIRVGPAIGKVLHVNPNSVDLQVLMRDGTERRWGVHHVSDPLVEASRDVKKHGAWDHTPKSKRIAELEERIKTLEELA